jgi:hypothetical protein
MSKTILPADPKEAMATLMRLTRGMLIMMREEARSISIRNEVAMLDAEALKERLLPEYQQAAQEFSQRIEEFRGMDPSLLDELQALQDELGAIARENQFNLAS